MGPLGSGTAIKRVAVIGAGPGGLAAAKYLVAEKAFSKIQVFEQRESVGGVWNPGTDENGMYRDLMVPKTRPSQVPTQPVVKHGPEGPTVKYISPVYDDLDTNIPHTIMNYSDFPFPKGSSLFPHHTAVREYLERYADDIRPLIALGTQVIDVEPVDSGKWAVKTRDIKTQEEKNSTFDGVVVANGHYDDPYIPDIAGIREWNSTYPKAITHSKFYRRPEEYKSKKVVVVGNNASGVDISAQISTTSELPLYISVKADWPLTPTSDPTTTILPEISEFIIQDRAVRFTNGHLLKNVDKVVFCTGYLYSFPFLKHLKPPIVTTGERTEGLYRQIFWRPNPTLSFIALPQRIVPFPISESQGAVIARVLSGRLSLPSSSEMLSWEKSRIAQHGAGKSFHILGFPADAQYINDLHAWSLSATRDPKLENDGVGKIPPYWGDKEQWIRERIPGIKSASRAWGKNRLQITTLEQLGFDFESWKKEGRSGAD